MKTNRKERIEMNNVYQSEEEAIGHFRELVSLGLGEDEAQEDVWPSGKEFSS